MIFNDKNEIKEVKNDIIEKELSELYNAIEKKRAQLRMKKNIIIKISNKLINTEMNLIDDNYDDLNILQIINILNYLDKSFSTNYFIPNNSQQEFYFQKEFNIIENIYTKIVKDYNISLNQHLEPLRQNFLHFSKKQRDSNMAKNNYSYYYIYDTLYDFIILILILNKNDINNKDIKYLSPVDKIFLCEDQNEQKLICTILNNYLNMNLISRKNDVAQELKTIYNIISLYTQIDTLKEKIKSQNSIIEENKLKENRNKNQLNEQDFCKIILKKEHIINQLETKIENLNRNTNTNNTNNNENTFRELEEENEMNKKEIEDMKRLYDVEFELMASAVYGLGINLFFNKEQQHNKQNINSSSWLSTQKDYVTDMKE